jgi:Deacetylase PdaC
MRVSITTFLVSAALAVSSPTLAFAAEEGGFSYDYPTELSAHPKLVSLLEMRKSERRTLFQEDVDALKGEPAANNLESQADWKIKSQNDRLIVLVSSNYVYSGGAHGMFWSDAILWDKSKQVEVALLDLFVDKDEAKKVIMLAYCAMLDAERLGMRGEPTPKDDLFGECVDPFEHGIAYPDKQGSAGYLRIAFALPPYSAGPYVEGEYEFDIAAPSHITDKLKPEYQDLFQTYM